MGPFLFVEMDKRLIREKIELLSNRLLLYLKAEQAILSGQSYKIEGLELTRANLANVQSMITKLMSDIEMLKARLNKTFRRSRIISPGW